MSIIKSMVPIITILISYSAFAYENADYNVYQARLTLQWLSHQELSQEYEKGLSEQVSSIWVNSKSCYIGKIESVSVILEINQIGAVTGVSSNHKGDTGSCINEKAIPVMFPKPPFKPFYMKIQMQ